MAITHKYTVVCDDIRREDNGKLMLIGVYSGNVVLPHVPFTLPSLAFFQTFDSDRPANLVFRMHLESLETGQRIFEGMGSMQIHRPGLGIAPVKFGPATFPTFGTYNFVITIEGEQPIITSFDVVAPPQQNRGQQQFRG